MAEIELHVLIGQCLKRRIAHIETVRNEVRAWQARRDSLKATINWQFTHRHPTEGGIKRLELARFANRVRGWV